jgi:quercetin dioxygenase-like cupin family protein
MASAADGLRTVALEAQPEDEPLPGVRRRVVSGERLTCTRYRFAPGARFPLHHHPQEQIVVVLDGAITFASATRSVRLGRGDALVIAPDVPHEATAGPDGATLVSAVAPARHSAADVTIEE